MGELSRNELDEIYAFAVELGKQAGKMLTDAAQLRISGGNGSQKEKAHVQKENAVDLVTETDESKSWITYLFNTKRVAISRLWHEVVPEYLLYFYYALKHDCCMVQYECHIQSSLKRRCN